MTLWAVWSGTLSGKTKVTCLSRPLDVAYAYLVEDEFEAIQVDSVDFQPLVGMVLVIAL